MQYISFHEEKKHKINIDEMAKIQNKAQNMDLYLKAK